MLLAILPVTAKGLSPRGRGNLRAADTGPTSSRSIPAWTGEPHVGIDYQCLTPVYPRVDGGTVGVVAKAASFAGLSPRGRGNPICAKFAVALIRSIPAWTGEPICGRAIRWGKTVYPRVDGGTRLGLERPICCTGLSPRGRGNPDSHGPTLGCNRSIPAWTGEP